MVTFKGFNTRIQYVSETAYGTCAAAVDTVISGKIKNFNPEMNNNFYRTQGLGEGRNETQTLLGAFDCKWTMELEVGTDFAFFKYLIGSRIGSGTTAAPYYLEEADIMKYAAPAPLLTSFKMEVGSEAGTTDDVDTYYGNIINRATFNFAIGKPLTASIEGFAKTVLSSTTATGYTANTDKVFMFQQGSFSFDATVSRVQSGSITVDNGYDPEENREMGSRFIAEPQPNERKYDWTVVVKMTDTIATTLRDYFYGQANSPSTGVTDAEPTSYAVILQFTEGAVSGDNIGKILISDNFIDRISKPVAVGGGYVEMTITGHGRKGTTDTINKPFIWWQLT